MFGLPAWAKVNHEGVAEDSVPGGPKEVMFVLDMVFPCSHPAAEESHWQGRGVEQGAPIVNSNFLFTVNRSPAKSGRSFEQSLPWISIFLHFYT